MATTDREKMKVSGQHIVPAFTIFEVTLVLALMSTIIAILAVSYNRFNEQLKNSSELHTEMNQFYAFRANLWRELYTSDSLAFDNNEVQIYTKAQPISYKIENEFLQRKVDQEWTDTGFAMLALNERQSGSSKIIDFIFDWKGEPMKLHYLSRPDLSDQMNQYFEHFD